MKIIGHRGAAGLEPENTLRSFRMALALGVDEIELDIWETKDGSLAVIHYEKVNRTTNGYGRVPDLDIDELRELDAGKGEKIPRLEEVFDLVKQEGIILNLELKKPGYEQRVADLIKFYNYFHRVFVISFLPQVIKKIKAIDSRIRIGLAIRHRLINAQKIVKELKIDRIFLKHTLITRQLVSDFSDFDVEVIAWTVDKPKDIQKMIILNIDGICTNYPDRVKKILSR